MSYGSSAEKGAGGGQIPNEMWEWWEKKDTSAKTKREENVDKTEIKLKWGASEYSYSYYTNYIHHLDV